jgi:hypothetical protein
MALGRVTICHENTKSRNMTVLFWLFDSSANSKVVVIGGSKSGLPVILGDKQ